MSAAHWAEKLSNASTSPGRGPSSDHIAISTAPGRRHDAQLPPGRHAQQSSRTRDHLLQLRLGGGSPMATAKPACVQGCQAPAWAFGARTGREARIGWAAKWFIHGVNLSTEAGRPLILRFAKRPPPRRLRPAEPWPRCAISTDVPKHSARRRDADQDQDRDKALQPTSASWLAL